MVRTGGHTHGEAVRVHGRPGVINSGLTYIRWARLITCKIQGGRRVGNKLDHAANGQQLVAGGGEREPTTSHEVKYV